MRRVILLSALCLGVLGCGAPAGAPPAPAGGGPAAGTQDAAGVYEAAFRYRLAKQPKDVEAFLSVDDKDAPAELLEKLRKDWPNLKPRSATPKEKGLWIYVNNLTWSHGGAEVEAGYWFPTKFAGQGYSGKHHLMHKGGQWQVERVTDEVMS